MARRRTPKPTNPNVYGHGYDVLGLPAHYHGDGVDEPAELVSAIVRHAIDTFSPAEHQQRSGWQRRFGRVPRSNPVAAMLKHALRGTAGPVMLRAESSDASGESGRTYSANVLVAAGHVGLIATCPDPRGGVSPTIVTAGWRNTPEGDLVPVRIETWSSTMRMANGTFEPAMAIHGHVAGSDQYEHYLYGRWEGVLPTTTSRVSAMLFSSTYHDAPAPQLSIMPGTNWSTPPTSATPFAGLPKPPAL